MWHSINRYVLCFFVWEASARQDMVQWSPPDVRLTLRGQITKRKYTLNSPKYAYKYHCTTKHECCSVYLIFTNHISCSVFIIWWFNFWGNVSQRVNDRIESWWGYIIACACCKLSCYNSSLALFIVAYSDTGHLKILTTDFLFFYRRVYGSAMILIFE